MINKHTVDVSIVSANFNNARFLSDYFESIIQSSVFPSEVIFIDDGSTDDSVSIASQFKNYDINLNIILLKEKMGLANALNIGVKESLGKYIMRLDTDDFINSDRIERQFIMLEKYPTLDIIGSNVYYFNDKLKKVVFESRYPISNDEIYSAFITGYHGLSHPSVMMKSEVLKAFKYKQEYFPAEEYEIFSRMVINHVSMQNISKPLTFYRVHKNSVSNSSFFESLAKTNEIRKKLFKTKTNYLQTWIRTLHLFYYRKALLTNITILKYIFLFLSLLCSPNKLIKRMKKLSI